MKKALITGVTGQDGAYLLHFLLEKDYQVHIIKRRTSTFSTARIDEIYDHPQFNNLFIAHYGDIQDGLGMMSVIHEVEPDEVYNLAAQSHVKVSFDNPVATVMTNISGTINILEAIRQVKLPARFYQASSSEMFGSTPPPQCENSPFHPRSPYACSKVYCYYQTINYREAYSMHASNGILFNHESPLRGETFVTRKITRAVGRIAMGIQDKLELGNLDAERDWGYAKEYVEAMWLMLQQDRPDDYVIATGETHTVREFCEYAFRLVGLYYQDYIKVNEYYYRPSEVVSLCGDSSKAKRKLNWVPKTCFKELVELMVENDVKLAAEEKKLGRFIPMY